jgi:hypothetical protein
MIAWMRNFVVLRVEIKSESKVLRRTPETKRK